MYSFLRRKIFQYRVCVCEILNFIRFLLSAEPTGSQYVYISRKELIFQHEKEVNNTF